MKYHFFQRILSLALVIFILGNSVVPCVSANEKTESVDVFTYWDDGTTKVVGYVERNGNKIFLQYVDDILVQL